MNKIKRFFSSSPDSIYSKIRKVTVNLSARLMGNTFSKLLGLITIPIIARALGSEGYGQFNLTLVTLGYIALLVDFGSTAYGVKECAKEPDASEIVNKILSARLTYVLFSVVVSIPVVFLLFRNPPGMVYVVFIGYIYVLAMGLNIDFFYFGKGNMLIPTMGQLTGQILYVLAVFFFISKKSDLPLLVFFFSLYYLLAAIIGIGFFVKKHKIRIAISLKVGLETLKETFRLGISGRLEMFLNSFPVIVVSAFLGAREVGLYSAAFRFYTLILIIFQTMMLAIAPYLVKLRKLDLKLQRKYLYYLMGAMVLVGILASTFFYIGGEWFLDMLFGKSFGEATPLFKLLCLIMIPVSPLNLILGSILIYFDYDKKYLYSTLAATGMILLASVLLVYWLSLPGAIWALSLANLTSITVSAYHVNKIIPGLFTPVN